MTPQRPQSCPLPHPRSRLKRPPSKRLWRRGCGMSSTPPPRSPLIPPEGTSQLPNVQPRFGHLVHLPTRAEAQAVLTLADAYVLEVPAKNANDILTALDQVVEKEKSINLSHLRRFARSGNLPRYVEDRRRAAKSNSIDNINGASQGLDPKNVQTTSKTISADGGSLFLLIGLTKLVALEAIEPLIKQLGISNAVLRTRVPVSPPMNPILSREWSDLYWPTQYRKSTPLGPHPTVIRQGADAVRPFVGYWMAQVINVAHEGQAAGYGPAIGALVVDSKVDSAPVPVAIATDARYGQPGVKCNTKDNIMNHAVMRAIGLIGRKRTSLATPSRESPKGKLVLDYPLLSLEEEVFAKSTLSSGGYLCTGLEMYLTHEPCVMCAQAILHSRFDKVIYKHRMLKTGAATPERPGTENAGLGYGLFWRPELNWRLLVWEWTEKAGSSGQAVTTDIHA